MPAYYNEIDPTAAHVLECLIKDGVIAPGVVDRRSIADVEPSDVKEFKQAHFFAGGGIWSVAARLAGWPDDRQLWTGSCPCQPFSVAGKGAGENDPRHLWPHFFRLIRACRPPVVVGEQVAGKAGYGWFDGVRADLESENYASRAVDIPACAVNAPHIRQRLYWCALADPERDRAGNFARALTDERGEIVDPWPESLRRADGPRLSGGFDARNSGDMVNADSSGRGEHSRIVSVSSQHSSAQCSGGDASVADADGGGRGRGPEIQERRQEQGAAAERVGCCDMADADKQYQRGHAGSARGQTSESNCETREADGNPAGGSRSTCRSWNDNPASFWDDTEWLTGADGKTRRAKPGLCLLVNGLSGRVGLLRIGGNAIVAPLAAEVLGALLETESDIG